MSLVTLRPLASVQVVLPSSALISVTAEPSRRPTLRSRRSWTNSSISSLSMKSRNVSRGSISVTATSSALKIVAYSTPITPAPITVMLRGRRGISMMPSPSNTVSSSNGTWSGRNGRVPHAIST